MNRPASPIQAENASPATRNISPSPMNNHPTMSFPGGPAALSNRPDTIIAPMTMWMTGKSENSAAMPATT